MHEYNFHELNYWMSLSEWVLTSFLRLPGSGCGAYIKHASECDSGVSLHHLWSLSCCHMVIFYQLIITWLGMTWHVVYLFIYLFWGLLKCFSLCLRSRWGVTILWSFGGSAVSETPLWTTTSDKGDLAGLPPRSPPLPAQVCKGGALQLHLLCFFQSLSFLSKARFIR